MSLEEAVSKPTPQEQADASIQAEQPVAPVATPQAAEPVEEIDEAPLPQKSEYDSLMERAARLGLRVRSNIGLDKLRERVNAAVAGEAPVADDDDEDDDEVEEDDQEEAPVTSSIPSPTAIAAATPAETAGQKRARLRNEARKLIRVRITNHNPAKSEHEGEIFTFGNAVVGTLKRHVPFGVEWHVEAAILEIIKNREFQYFQERKVNGQMVKTAKFAREFAVEILPPLTNEELRQLAQRQAMAAGTQEV